MAPRKTELETVALKTEYHPKIEVPCGLISAGFIIQRREDGSPIKRPVVDERGVDFVAELAKERIQHKYDCVINYTGGRGTGKSTLAQNVAFSINPDFPLEAIHWEYQNWREAIRNMPKANPAKGWYPQIILDEAGFDLYSKDWMMRLQKDAAKMLQIIRVRGLILHLIMPHIQDLIKDIRDSMAYLWVNTDPRKELMNERGYAEVRVGHLNKFHRAEWWNPRCGFWFPELDGKFWDAYSKKKDEFTETVFAKQDEQAIVALTPAKRTRNNGILNLYKGGMTQEKIAQIFGMSREAVTYIIKKSDLS